MANLTEFTMKEDIAYPAAKSSSNEDYKEMVDNLPDLDLSSDDSSYSENSSYSSSSFSPNSDLFKPCSSFLSQVSIDEDDKQKRKSAFKKTVTFSPTIVFHCHKIILGDSPSCPILPLTLDWEHAEPQILDLDKYESSPATIRRRRRARRCSGGSGSARKLMYFERTELLQDVAGYTPAQLRKAKQEAIAAVQAQAEQDREERRE